MKLSRILCLAALLFAVLCVAACGNDPPPDETAAVTTAPATTTPSPPVTSAAATAAPATTQTATTTAPVTTAPVTSAPAPSALIDAANAALANRREPYRATLAICFRSQNPLIALLLPELDMHGEQVFDGENADISFRGLGRAFRLILVGDTAYATLPTDGGEDARLYVAVNEEEKRALLSAAITLPPTDLSAFDSVTATRQGDVTAITCKQVDPALLASLNDALDELETATADMGLSYTATAVTTVFHLLPDGSYRDLTLTVDCNVKSRDVPFMTIPATVSFTYTLDYEGEAAVLAPEDTAEYTPTTIDDILKELPYA